MGYNHFEAPWEGPNLRPFVLTKEIIKDPLLSNHLGHFLCGVWEDVEIYIKDSSHPVYEGGLETRVFRRLIGRAIANCSLRCTSAVSQ